MTDQTIYWEQMYTRLLNHLDKKFDNITMDYF